MSYTKFVLPCYGCQQQVTYIAFITSPLTLPCRPGALLPVQSGWWCRLLVVSDASDALERVLGWPWRAASAQDHTQPAAPEELGVPSSSCTKLALRIADWGRGSEQAGSQASSSIDRSAAGVGHSAPVASNATSGGLLGENREKEAAEAFAIHCERVRSLLDFVLPRNNVHKEIKAMARAASKTLGEYSKLLRLGPAVTTPLGRRKDGGCQTSPIFRPNVPQNTGEHEPPPPPLPPAAKKRKADGDMHDQSKVPDWATVVKKGKEKKKKTKGSQPQQQQQQQRGASKPADQSEIRPSRCYLYNKFPKK
ncbi:hypothetical protein TSAR_013798 [Trichomalopsis sarcophagae]|uniref:Uncharacterized protein n=1 Tax=Trichomalopsis sarcophagae TaxID=543379 RepID=A0A232ELD6_9HYME|nr:hypothetical protein TSAR_013798 [Trichomalopsis sarcophagae]